MGFFDNAHCFEQLGGCMERGRIFVQTKAPFGRLQMAAAERAGLHSTLQKHKRERWTGVQVRRCAGVQVRSI